MDINGASDKITAEYYEIIIRCISSNDFTQLIPKDYLTAS